jgi:hypothetical protein
VPRNVITGFGIDPAATSNDYRAYRRSLGKGYGITMVLLGVNPGKKVLPAPVSSVMCKKPGRTLQATAD